MCELYRQQGGVTAATQAHHIDRFVGIDDPMRLDRITRRVRTLSQLLDGASILAADMPGADESMLRIYAAMAPCL